MQRFTLLALLFLSINGYSQQKCNIDELRKEVLLLIKEQNKMIDDSIYIINTLTFSDLKDEKSEKLLNQNLRYMYVANKTFRFYIISQNLENKLQLLNYSDHSVLKEMSDNCSDDKISCFDYFSFKSREYLLNFSIKSNSSGCALVVATVIDLKQ